MLSPQELHTTQCTFFSYLLLQRGLIRLNVEHGCPRIPTPIMAMEAIEGRLYPRPRPRSDIPDFSPRAGLDSPLPCHYFLKDTCLHYSIQQSRNTPTTPPPSLIVWKHKTTPPHGKPLSTSSCRPHCSKYCCCRSCRHEMTMAVCQGTLPEEDAHGCCGSALGACG